MKKPSSPKSPLKAARKGSREAEIELYGHPLPRHAVHRSKKEYCRKVEKARLKNGGSFHCGIVILGEAKNRCLSCRA